VRTTPGPLSDALNAPSELLCGLLYLAAFSIFSRSINLLGMDPRQTAWRLLDKAHTAVDDAAVLLEHGSAEATVNRAYYAVFHAARAALQVEDEAPGTHAGVLRRFGYHFVRTGRVDEATGSILTTAHAARNSADYDAITRFDRAAAGDLVADAGRFVATLCLLIQDEVGPPPDSEATR